MFLRSLLLIVNLVFGMIAFAQQRVTVYFEGFGAGVYPEAVLTDFTGWDNPDVVHEGTGKIGPKSSSHVCTLPGSSRQGFLYFSSDNIRDIKFCHIDIEGYSDLMLSFNLKKNRVYSGTLLVEMYVDNKKVASYKPNLKNDDEWFAMAERSIPKGKVLDLVLRNEDVNVTLYMDDFLITGVPDAPVAPDKPSLTPAGGLYTEPVSLVMTAAEGADIYYTLDGTVPSESSEKYQEPVVLDHTATVSAIAVSEAGSSEVVTENYEILNVPVVADVPAFRNAGEMVRLDLDHAEVVDAGTDGFCVQTASGGLLLPPLAVDAEVGDQLTGFLIGKPQLRYSMTGVTDGIFSQISVTHVPTAPIPLNGEFAEVLAQPERYAACLLQLEGLVYRSENATVCPKDEADGEKSLRVVTGAWAQEATWTWPEEMTLQGVLKEDDKGLFLWVAAATQVIATGQQVKAEPLGTALVITESAGLYYAVRTYMKNKALLVKSVAVLQGRAVVAPENATDLLWDINESKGYLRNPDGRYLQLYSTSSADLAWADKPNQSCVWSKDDKVGFWGSGTRALNCRLKETVKNYSKEYIGMSGYSVVPAVDMPLYAGYLRSLSPGRWGTVCVPYAVQKGDCAGALFFEIKGRLNDADGNARSIVLSEPVDHLEAGVPYVFYAESSLLTLLYAGEPVESPLAKNGLQGSFDGVNTGKDAGDTALEGKYVFSGNVLHKCAAGSSVAKNKAYVDLDKVPLLSETPAGALRIQVSQEATGIDTLTAPGLQEDRVYSLSGLYLGTWNECGDKLKKGIYIINRRKFVVK